jgi:predicted RecB family endonuclease
MHVNSLEDLINEYGFTDEEINFALERAKGIIFGFAMEYRARKVLENYNFTNIKSVNLPTHDIEAEKDGEKYYIEVKASKKSPTKEYSAYKIAMIAQLHGIHLTLVMLPSPRLYLTEEILSEPKRVLFEFFKMLFNNENDKLKEFLANDKNRKIVESYNKVITHYFPEIKDLTSLEIIRPIL